MPVGVDAFASIYEAMDCYIKRNVRPCRHFEPRDQFSLVMTTAIRGARLEQELQNSVVSTHDGSGPCFELGLRPASRRRVAKATNI